VAETSRLMDFLHAFTEHTVYQLPRLEDDEFRYLMAPWRIAAYGRRPVDYIARDLLFGSLGRDYRARVFNRLRSDLPEWIKVVSRRSDSESESGQSPKMMYSHFLLRAIHTRHLAELALRSEGERKSEELQKIRLLDACCPMGLLYDWNGAEVQNPFRPCRLARACPWCHCRKVVRLYRELLAGPCDPAKAGNKILIMVKVRIDEEPEEQVDSEVLTRNQVCRTIKVWQPKLEKFGTRLGLSGGLVGHQVGPVLLPDNRRSFRHEFSLLGEVDHTRNGEWSAEAYDRFRHVAGFAAPEDHQPLLAKSLDWGPTFGLEVTIMRMADPNALRWLLAGSAAHRKRGDSAFVRIERNTAALTYDGSLHVRRTIGVDGALALQPTFLFTAKQFWSQLEALRGSRMYRRFGSWIGSEGDEARLGALNRLNGDRRRLADEDVERLAAETRPIFDALTATLGRVPGRSVFAKELQRLGHELPRRRVVALLKTLDTRPAKVAG
jgi:hypothetical protein